MSNKSMADAVRAVLVKRAFVPGGDPSMGGGMPPPGGDPSMGGGMPPPGGDPSMGGGMPPPGAMPPGGDPSMGGGMPPPGMDPSMMGDPMAGMPPPGMDPSMMGGPAPQTGMINMTADEFTKFIKQMMAAFGQGGAAPAQPQQAQPDIGAKLDTLIAVLQNKSAAPAVAGA